MAEHEEWRPIPGFDGYEASSLGRIRSFRGWRGRIESTPHLLNPPLHPSGYFQARLGGRSRWLAGLIAHTFLGPTPDGMEICHNNGVRTDNRVVNLRFDTPSNNQADKIRHGTNLRKLTPEGVERIRREYVKGRGPERRGNARILAAELGISPIHVQQVARGRTSRTRVAS